MQVLKVELSDVKRAHVGLYVDGIPARKAG